MPSILSAMTLTADGLNAAIATAVQSAIEAAMQLRDANASGGGQRGGRKETRTIAIKVIDGMRNFEGSESQWSEWEYKFRVAVGAANKEGGMALDDVMKRKQVVDMADLDLEEKYSEEDMIKISSEIFEMLCLKTDGEALRIVRAVEDRDGFKAWWALHSRYNPRTFAKAMRVMVEVVKPGQVKDIKDVETAIGSWEEKLRRLLRDYPEEKISDKMQQALVTSMMPATVQDVIFQKTDGYNSMREMKEAIVALVQNKLMNKTAGPQKMEIDQVEYEDWWYGLNEAEVNYVSGVRKCFNCDGIGHFARDCPRKGKGKGNGNMNDGKAGGKGKGGKDWSKGGDWGKGGKGGKSSAPFYQATYAGKGASKGTGWKGKSQGRGYEGECWTCGKIGHKWSECRSGINSAEEEECEEGEGESQVGGIECEEDIWGVGAVEVVEEEVPQDEPMWIPVVPKPCQDHGCAGSCRPRRKAGRPGKPTLGLTKAFEQDAASMNRFAVLEREFEEHESDEKPTMDLMEEFMQNAAENDRLATLEYVGDEGDMVEIQYVVEEGEADEVCEVEDVSAITATNEVSQNDNPEEDGSITIDSGAGRSVWPIRWKSGGKTQKTNQTVKLRAANGTPIKVYGEKKVVFRTKEMRRRGAIKFLVSDVRKPLAAVSGIVDEGNVVVFGPGDKGSYIMNVETSEKIYMTRKNGTYSIKVDVEGEKHIESVENEKYTEKNEKGFTRRAP